MKRNDERWRERRYTCTFEKKKKFDNNEPYLMLIRPAVRPPNLNPFFIYVRHSPVLGSVWGFKAQPTLQKC